VEHIAALRCLRAGTVIDVGANRGQFSVVARRMFPTAEIHAFEPLARERAVFQSVVAGATTSYALAIGARKGEETFFVASRRDSSSLLKPGQGSEAGFGVTLVSSIAVQVARLSDVLDIAELPRPILLKLDVQGAELAVLEGAADILPQICWIYTEASFVRLYEGQPLVGEIIDFLAQRAFGLRGVFNHSATPELGPAQADFLFMNEPLAGDASARLRAGTRGPGTAAAA